MKKKKMSRKFKIILSIVIALVAVIGGVGAYFISEANKAPAQIEDSVAKYKSTLKEAPTDGSLPTDHSVFDNIAYVLWKVENTNSFKVTTSGEADASVTTQLIAGERIIIDKTAMVSTVSSGMISLAKQKYYNNNKVLIRDYEKLEGVNPTWKNQIPECITYKEMISRYGWLPFQANGYIICDETFLNKDEIKLEVLDNGLYKIAFNLNPEPDYGPFWYRREILTNSGSTIIPEFISIHIEFTFDKNYTLIYQDFVEEYKVKAMGVEAVTKTNCHDEFTYDNISYNPEYIDYFNKYKDLTPKEFDENTELVIEDDIASMIISSLQNGENDSLFDIKLKLNDKELNGNIALNISDLSNVKVNANINGIEVDYIDNNLYLTIGELKLKCDIPYITSLIPSNDLESSLDVNQILADLNSSNIVEDGNNKYITSTLNLLGINLNLEFDITKIDNNYVLNKGIAKVSIDDFNIEIELTKGNKTFDKKDYSDYSEIKNLDFIIDLAKSIINNKNVGFNSVINYSNLKIVLSGDISFADDLLINLDTNIEYKGINILANIQYIDNIVYFNYGNLHISLKPETIMKYINIDSIDIDSIINKLFEINFNELFNEFRLEENDLSLKLTLKELNDKLSLLQLEIKNDNNINVDLIYDKLNVNLIVRDYKEIALNNYEYYQLEDLSFVIDGILGIIKDKKLALDLSLKLNDKLINAKAYIDFNDEIKIKAIISFNSNDLVIYYFKESNKLYIELDKFYGYLSLDNLLSNFDTNINLDKIINLLSTIELDKIISYLSKNDNISKLGLDLSFIDTDIIDLSKIIDIYFKEIDNGINIMIPSLYEININMLYGYDGEIELADKEYNSLDTYIKTIIDLVNTINKKSFRINIASNINLNSFVSILNKDIELNGYIDFIYDNDNYNIVSNLDIKYDKITTNIDIIYDNEYLYLGLLGLNIKLDINNIDTFINELLEKFNIDKNFDINIEGLIDKLIPVINSISFINDNSISVDLSSLVDKISILTITLLMNDKFEANLNMEFMDLKADIDIIDKYEITYNDNYYGEDDILRICDIVNKVLDISKKKEFNINLALAIYDSGVKHLDISGSAEFYIYDNGKFDLDLSVEIDQYEKEMTKYHFIDLLLITKEHQAVLNNENPYENNNYVDMVYITYGTIPNSDSKIKLYLPLNKLLSMVSTLSNLLGLDLSFLNSYSDLNFNNIDTNQIKNLFGSSLDKNIDLNNIINNLNVSEGLLDINLNLDSIIPQGGNSTFITLNVNENNDRIAEINLNHLYLKYNSVADNSRLDIDYIKLINDDVTINMPNTSGYYDISDINKLVDGLITTATYKDFEIDTTITFSVLSLININVPVNAKIKVDEDGKPIIHVHMDFSSIDRLVVPADYLDIYYKDGYVYLYRKDKTYWLFVTLGGDEYNVKLSYQTFLDDIVYYLLDYGMGLSDLILNAINKDNSNESHRTDAGKVLNSYSVSGNEYSLNLSLYEILGNKNLGDIKLTLGLDNVITNNETGETNLALAYIKNLSVKLVSVIDIKANSINLSNIKNNMFTDVDLTALNNYIDNYGGNTDTFYKNGSSNGSVSHKITFVLGLGQSDVIIEGKSGTKLNYPNVSTVSYNEENYEFIGWYLDKNLSENATLNVIEDDNIKIYAGYRKID